MENNYTHHFGGFACPVLIFNFFNFKLYQVTP